MCSSVSGTGTAVLGEFNLSHSLGSGRTGLHNRAAEHLYSNNYRRRSAKIWGRKGGRMDTVTERILHQHHEITCSEADHCFLQEKTLIRLL